MLPLLLEDTRGGRKEKKEPLGDEPEASSREWERLVEPARGGTGRSREPCSLWGGSGLPNAWPGDHGDPPESI